MASHEKPLPVVCHPKPVSPRHWTPLIVSPTLPRAKTLSKDPLVGQEQGSCGDCKWTQKTLGIAGQSFCTAIKFDWFGTRRTRVGHYQVICPKRYSVESSRPRILFQNQENEKIKLINFLFCVELLFLKRIRHADRRHFFLVKSFLRGDHVVCWCASWKETFMAYLGVR